MKIMFSGGGTLGPVTPLLAIYEVIKEAHPEAEFFWVGTTTGPEKEFVESHGIYFAQISSGKLRRYLSFWNIVDFFKIIKGFFQSIKIIWKQNPDVCISAGGFVSVPLHYAGWMFGVKTWIHQQDVRIGLTNKIMAPIAKIITVALENNLKKFPKFKTYWLGNPIRKNITSGSKEKAKKMFGLNSKEPVVFVTGGGTGSIRVNQLLLEAIPDLDGYCQIIHLTGKNRPQGLTLEGGKHVDYYHPFKFFTEEMKHAYAASDIIVSRGGFGTITEIAALKKTAIIIPKPGHQYENVRFLEKANAAIFINETTADGHYLARQIRDLLEDTKKSQQMAKKMSEILPLAKSENILKLLHSLYKKKR